MVTIATFNEPAEAKHLKQRLQEAGVKADIHNEAGMQKVMLAAARANAKVMVREKDFPKAQQLLADWGTSDPDLRLAVRCPQCQSPRVQYPQLARSFPFIPGLAAILFALEIFQKEFYCEDCHYTWTKDQQEKQ